MLLNLTLIIILKKHIFNIIVKKTTIKYERYKNSKYKS